MLYPLASNKENLNDVYLLSTAIRSGNERALGYFLELAHMRYVLLFAITLLTLSSSAQSTVRLREGWRALVTDNDSLAIRCFWETYRDSRLRHDDRLQAEAALFLGMASYGSRPEKGMAYAVEALHLYEKTTTGHEARIGRGRCLQLMATIRERQGKSRQALQWSRQALALLERDTTGTKGLARLSIGRYFENQGQVDTAVVYYQRALADFRSSHQYAYLPGAYTRLALIQMNQNPDAAFSSLSTAWAIASKTHNRQAEVATLLALGKAETRHRDPQRGLQHLQTAYRLAQSLSDRQFELRALEGLAEWAAAQGHVEDALEWQRRVIQLKDSVFSAESERAVREMEVQFGLAEKERELALVSKEREVARLTNLLLGGALIVLLAGAAVGFVVLRKIRRKDRELLAIRTALVTAMEAEKALREHQYRADLEHRESQLSAITLQMQRKNEFAEELRASAGAGRTLSPTELQRMVNRHFSHGYDWEDFDTYFEGLNLHFYTRLRELYPGISQNDLKLCALIRLNLSTKEMAGILNISPDSVKTARYRLRRKLQLPGDENLTRFLLSL